MGGQQFLTDGPLLDMRQLNRVRTLDEEHGLLQVEAGITWPDVIRGYLVPPNGARASSWGIRQKQTGADRLTIGGAVAANIHGRCLTAPPFIADIESLEVAEHLPADRAGIRAAAPWGCSTPMGPRPVPSSGRPREAKVGASGATGRS